MCILQSQRCYAAPFRVDAPLPMGSTTTDPGHPASLGCPIERGMLGPAGAVASRVSAGRSMAEGSERETESSILGLGQLDSVSVVPNGPYVE